MQRNVDQGKRKAKKKRKRKRKKRNRPESENLLVLLENATEEAFTRFLG